MHTNVPAAKTVDARLTGQTFTTTSSSVFWLWGRNIHVKPSCVQRKWRSAVRGCTSSNLACSRYITWRATCLLPDRLKLLTRLALIWALMAVAMPTVNLEDSSSVAAARRTSSSKAARSCKQHDSRRMTQQHQQPHSLTFICSQSTHYVTCSMTMCPYWQMQQWDALKATVVHRADANKRFRIKVVQDTGDECR